MEANAIPMKRMNSSFGDTPFWLGYPLAFWDALSAKLLVAAVVTGIVAALASRLSSWIGSAVTSKVQNTAGSRITATEFELQKSQERTGELEVAIAGANARAAEANQVAEEERLARVRIEAGLASRRLSTAQAARFTSTLAAARDMLPALNITLLGDQEAQAFGSDIVAAAQAAEIKVSVSRVGIMAPPMYGVLVIGKSSGTLMAALAAAGVSQVQYTSSTTPAIIVGLKPPPS